ncbi:MAG: acyltransferase domain-containing protein, partial [Candidatus Electrothrix sp. AUS4]|nr:acyltransferase domain-containing protein [Candidatus Electrothrix sp. AUS4]
GRNTFPTEEYCVQAEELIRQTNITQPVLFLIEYCLAQLWLYWGIKPTAMVGHSIGEYVAACLSGVFSLDDALQLVAARGRLMHSLPPGSMLAVAQTAEEVASYLSPDLSLAVINGTKRCVVSGSHERIEQLKQQLDTDGVSCQTLQTSHAFHSHLMEPILEEFTDIVAKMHCEPAKIPFVSNVTGTWITEAETSDPNYWAKHLRRTVNFFGCMQTLFENQTGVLLEIGPDQTLTFLSKQHPNKNKEHIILASTRRPAEQKNDHQVILQSLGQLWMTGLEIDWQHVHAQETRSRIPLPTYPFERKKYRIEERKTAPLTSLPNSSLPTVQDDGNERVTENELIADCENNTSERSAHDMEILMAEIWKKLLV